MKSKQAQSRQRPRLDRATIIKAAIVRIERCGLEELSARKLAQDLGCEAMSLYHHVKSMEALKDSIVDHLLATVVPAERAPSLETVRGFAEAYLDVATRYARSFQLVATRRWTGTNAVDAASRVVASFQAIGFDHREALVRARALGAYLNGAGLALAAWMTDESAPATEARRVRADLHRGLNLLFRSLAATEPPLQQGR